jgi:small subunit ribosomal protein S10
MEMKTNAKTRVRLESFNHELLVSSCQKIINLLETASSNSIGMITLPTSKRIYCVLRSPHVDKDSREHFEIRIHKRILEISYNLEMPIIDLLLELDLPPGVFYRLEYPK